MCHHNDFVTCHRDSFNCNPFIVVANFKLFIVMLRHLKPFIEDLLLFSFFFGGGGALRDPPWVPSKSTNARVLYNYGGLTTPPPSSRTLPDTP